MKQLCYIPRPAEFESPKSLLLRTAHYNGFGTIKNLCTYFAPKPRRWVEVLGKNSTLLEALVKEAPLLADDMRKAFYTVEPDDPFFIKAGNISLPRGACSNDFIYCPQCIDATKWPVFHDVRDIGVCLLHGMELIQACPRCRTAEHWYNAKLFHCKCGFERSTANRVHRSFISIMDDAFHSPQVVRDISIKYSIAKVCASLWDAFRDNANHTCCDLPLQVIKYIDFTVAEQVARYPGFIRSLHRAPWFNYGSASVAWLADRALGRNFANRQSCFTKDCCRLTSIDRNNAKHAMFNGRPVSADTARICGLRGWAEHQSSWSYTIPPRCEIIRRVNAEHPVLAESEQVDYDGLTEDEAAALLKCPLSVVHGLRNNGWLKRLDRKVLCQSLLPDVLDRASIEMFARRYIILHELCETLNMPAPEIVDRINMAGIQTKHCASEAVFFNRTMAVALFNQRQVHPSDE